MNIQQIESKIFEIRGVKVMLDFDLAELYEVETRILNQAVKRNADLFPMDFHFQLNIEEWQMMSSQIVMTSNKRPKSSLPFAFTEHGVAMLSNVLKSKKARETSIKIIRSFIQLNKYIYNFKELYDKVKQLEQQNNKKFNDIYDALNYLINKDNQEIEQKERKKIGFKP